MKYRDWQPYLCDHGQFSIMWLIYNTTKENIKHSSNFLSCTEMGELSADSFSTTPFFMNWNVCKGLWVFWGWEDIPSKYAEWRMWNKGCVPCILQTEMPPMALDDVAAEICSLSIEKHAMSREREVEKVQSSLIRHTCSDEIRGMFPKSTIS